MTSGNPIDIYRAAGELYYHLRQYLGDGELTMGATVGGPIVYRWRSLSPAGSVVVVDHMVSPVQLAHVIPEGVGPGGFMVKAIGDDMRETRETEGYRASW